MTYGDWLPTKLESIDPSDHKSICGFYQETLYAVLTHIKRLEWRQEKTTRSCHTYKSKSLTPRWRLFARISRIDKEQLPSTRRDLKGRSFVVILHWLCSDYPTRFYQRRIHASEALVPEIWGVWSSSSPKRRQHSVHQSFC